MKLFMGFNQLPGLGKRGVWREISGDVAVGSGMKAHPSVLPLQKTLENAKVIFPGLGTPTTESSFERGSLCCKALRRGTKEKQVFTDLPSPYSLQE